MGWSLICVLVSLALSCYGLVFDLCSSGSYSLLLWVGVDLCSSVSHFVGMGWSLISVLVSLTPCCYGLVLDLCSSVSYSLLLWVGL